MTISLFTLASGMDMARLTLVKGNVLINGEKITSPQGIKEGDLLKAKGPRSLFAVLYQDGSRFLVRNGELRIEKLKKKETEMSLLKGTIYSYLKKKNKGNKNQMTIRTKTASYGVRGTKFYVTEEDEKSYLCVCEGSVEAMKEDGDKVTLNALEEIWAKNDTGLKKKPATVEHVKKAIKWFQYLDVPLNQQANDYVNK